MAEIISLYSTEEINNDETEDDNKFGELKDNVLIDSRSIEENFKRFYLDPSNTKISNRWKLISLLNLVLTFWSGIGSTCMLIRYNNTDMFLRIVDNYDGGHFTVLLAMIGLTACLTFFFGFATSCVVSIDFRKREMKYLVYAYLGWAVGLLFVSTIALITCLLLNSIVPKIFGSGFVGNMLKYKSDIDVKAIIDILQHDNHCCGNINHTEWFLIDFSNDYYKTDIGFPTSCCNVVKYPIDNCTSKAANMQADLLTPYKAGCFNILINMFRKTLKYIMVIFMVIIFADGLCFLLALGNVKASNIYNEAILREKERMISLKFRRAKEVKKSKMTLFEVAQNISSRDESEMLI